MGPDGDGANSALEAGLKNMAELRQRTSMSVVAAEAASRHGNISAQTVLAWFNQYNSNGYVKLDDRGAGLKERILSEDDLLFVLLQYMKNEKRLTVSKVVEFINDKLLTKTHTSTDDAKMKDVYGIVKPVSRGLVGTLVDAEDGLRVRPRHSSVLHRRPQQAGSDRRSLGVFGGTTAHLLAVAGVGADAPRRRARGASRDYRAHKYEREVVAFIEFHVTRLGRVGEASGEGTSTGRGAFDIVRKKPENGGNFSVRFEAEADSPYRAAHEGVCFCHLPAWHMGQDECIFKAYLREGKEWVVAGVHGLRKKNRGCRHHGFGIPG